MNDQHPDSPEEKAIANLTTRKLLILSLVSANVYLFISLIIIHFLHDGGLIDLFNSEINLWMQAGYGLGAGVLASLVVYVVIKLPPVADILSDFFIFEALSKSNFSFFDNAQVSVFAGAGEELLFRGAIQPLLGNALTSIIFIGIHGYFKFKSVGHIIFGVVMFGLSYLLGFLAESVSLISAIIAHTIYDLIMLQVLQHQHTNNTT